jgi:hypothetical protein
MISPLDDRCVEVKAQTDEMGMEGRRGVWSPIRSPLGDLRLEKRVRRPMGMAFHGGDKSSGVQVAVSVCGTDS